MKIIILILSLIFAVQLQAAQTVITNWAGLGTVPIKGGDIILMQQGGLLYHFTPNNLATNLSTNEVLLLPMQALVAGASNTVAALLIANDIITSNGIYSVETTRNSAVSNAVMVILSATTNGLASILVANDTVTSNGLYSSETTRNGAVSNGVVALLVSNDTVTSNALRTVLIANDTTTSNGVVVMLVANDTTTSNALWTIVVANDSTTSNTLRAVTVNGLTNKAEIKPIFNRFFVAGDSLSAGATSWWFTLTNEFASFVSTTNTATGGWALSDLESDYATHILPSNPTTNDLLSVWIGANDYGNALPTNWIARHLAYCNTLTSNGATLILLTIMPRAPVYSHEQGETNRTLINNYIRGFTNAYICDVARAFDNPSNTFLFSGDGVHLNAYGYRTVAGMVRATLQSSKQPEGASLITAWSNSVAVMNKAGQVAMVADSVGSYFERKVGVGTFFPVAPLEVAGSGTLNSDFRISRIGDSNAYTFISSQIGSANAALLGVQAVPALAVYYTGGVGIGAYADANVSAPANGLAVSGKVGLATTTPTNALDVVGHTSLRSNLFLANLPTNGSPIALLSVDADGQVYETAVSSGGVGSSPSSTFRYAIGYWGDSLVAGNFDALSILLQTNHLFNGGIGGETSTQIKNRLLADTNKWNWTTIIWAGQNDPTVGVVETNVAAMVATLTHTNYLVVGLTLATNFGPGNATYVSVRTINTNLATTYGNRYLDIHSYLVSQANTNTEYYYYTNDMVPPSLLADFIHLNQFGHSLAATQIMARLSAVWVPAENRPLSAQDVSAIFGNSPGLGDAKSTNLMVAAIANDTNVFGLAKFWNPFARTEGRYVTVELGRSEAVGQAGYIGHRAYATNTTNSGIILFNYGDSELTQSLFLRNGGKLGLGMQTPTATFDIGAQGEATVRITGNLNTAGANAQLVFANASIGNERFAIGWDKINNGLNISSGGSVATAQLLTVLDTGLVGIGTTNPASKLVLSDPNATVLRIRSNTGGAGGNRDAQIWFENFSTPRAAIGLDVSASTLVFSVDGLGTITSGDASQAGAVYLNTANGNFGLRTNSPQASLHVHGNAIVNAGSLGINTSATNALDVSGHASIRTNLYLPNLPTNAAPIALLGVDAAGEVYETSISPTISYTTVAPSALHSVTIGKGWTNDLGVRADIVLSLKLVDAISGDPALAFTNSITGEAWTNTIIFGAVSTAQYTVVIPDISPNDRGSFTDVSTGTGSTLTILNAWWKTK